MNKKSITFLILELIFFVVAPLITIFSCYPTFVQSQQVVSSRVNIGIILSLMLLWIVLRKTLLMRRIAKAQLMEAQMEADLKVEPQGERRDNLITALRALKTERCVMSAVMPLLLFVLVVAISFGLLQMVTALQQTTNDFFNALKDELSKYALCIFIVTLEFVAGTVFSVLHERATVE